MQLAVTIFGTGYPSEYHQAILGWSFSKSFQGPNSRISSKFCLAQFTQLQFTYGHEIKGKLWPKNVSGLRLKGWKLVEAVFLACRQGLRSPIGGLFAPECASLWEP